MSEILQVGEADFEEQVLERSKTVPVVVDFWAQWCGPCRTLGPVLEELAAEANGDWVLAKVDVDENPGLAQAFQVQGIPAVKAFVNGRMENEFTGALPRAAIESFLRQVIPSPADRLAREAAEAGDSGDVKRERELWDAVLEQDPAHSLARVRRARLLAKDGDVEAARADLDEIAEGDELRPDAENLLRLLDWAELVAGAGGPEAVREAAAEYPESAAARYGFGCALAVAGDFPGAMAEFLEVVRLDREFDDDAGRLALLALFGLLGDEHELTREYRGKLSALLF